MLLKRNGFKKKQRKSNISPDKKVEVGIHSLLYKTTPDNLGRVSKPPSPRSRRAPWAAIRCVAAIRRQSHRTHAQLRGILRSNRQPRTPEGNCRRESGPAKSARLQQHCVSTPDGRAAGPLRPLWGRHQSPRPHPRHSRRVAQCPRQRLGPSGSFSSLGSSLGGTRGGIPH
jgi:hypothetical protein